ncbi:hypothetical protein RHS04_07831 [Rhizoctonia solani]|uniref:Uncharacterized protein n=1 Tax=Rhizoctonia solani TaxID=456999 RepID=A0A8H7H121_9AGAM|nr:hypothetical protein RHS04_07831 [Rhizoctonia solani]
MLRLACSIHKSNHYPSPDTSLEVVSKTCCLQSQATHQLPESDDKGESLVLEASKTPRPKLSTSKKGKAVPKTGDNGAGKAKKEHGTKLQGLCWIIYAACLVLNSLAEFEEMVTICLQTQHAMYNACVKAAQEESKVKALELEMQQVILKQWELLGKSGAGLIEAEVQLQLHNKDQEIIHLQTKLAKVQGALADKDCLLEEEKHNAKHAKADLLEAQATLLCQKRYEATD